MPALASWPSARATVSRVVPTRAARLSWVGSGEMPTAPPALRPGQAKQLAVDPLHGAQHAELGDPLVGLRG